MANAAAEHIQFLLLLFFPGIFFHFFPCVLRIPLYWELSHLKKFMINVTQTSRKFRLLEKRGLLLWKCSETYRNSFEKLPKECEKLAKAPKSLKHFSPYRASTITIYISSFKRKVSLHFRESLSQDIFIKKGVPSEVESAISAAHKHFYSFLFLFYRFH